MMTRKVVTKKVNEVLAQKVAALTDQLDHSKTETALAIIFALTIVLLAM